MVILLLLCYQNKLLRSMLSSHYSSKLASFFSKFFLSFANRKQSSGNNCSDESEDKTQTRVKSATYMIIKIKYYVPEIRAPIELSFGKTLLPRCCLCLRTRRGRNTKVEFESLAVPNLASNVISHKSRHSNAIAARFETKLTQ